MISFRLSKVFLDIIIKDIFVVNETALEKINHHDYSFKYEFRYLLILIIRHQLKQLI